MITLVFILQGSANSFMYDMRVCQQFHVWHNFKLFMTIFICSVFTIQYSLSRHDKLLRILSYLFMCCIIIALVWSFNTTQYPTRSTRPLLKFVQERACSCPHTTGMIYSWQKDVTNDIYVYTKM